MTELSHVVLASASPRRVDLLRSLGLDVVVRPTGATEGPIPGATPRELATTHAATKAEMGLAALSPANARARGHVLVAADTAVDVDGEALGKPRDDDDARAMLARLAGREHLVHTAVVCVDLADGRRLAFTETTAVRFRSLDDATLAAYVRSGDGRDKAGSYGIQGLGATLVERIDGDFYTVMGFPIARFTIALGEFDYVLPGFAPALAETSR